MYLPVIRRKNLRHFY